jgi:large subunit ribosomal protein L13
MPRQTTLAKPGQLKRSWRIIDAEGIPLGRLATRVATVLMGKHRPEYTPHVDCGDFVIITNASKIALTGHKADQKVLQNYSRYPGGLKTESYGSLRERRPQKMVEKAVSTMLPKGRLGRQMIKKMKIYAGPEHPHAGQHPIDLN